MLSCADDPSFFVMCWSAHAIQSGREPAARGLFQYPAPAVTQDITSKYYCPPWMMETLLNELLCIPKAKVRHNGPTRILRCDQFSALAAAINVLHDLENAEDGITIGRISVLREIHRLAQRQFEWQRGFVSYTSLFRSAFLYSEPQTNSFFESKTGLSISDFILSCFALYSLSAERPFIIANNGMEKIGISRSTFAAVMKAISLPIHKAREAAAQLRNNNFGHTAYKPSIFRSWPCVTFGDRICSPLPPLIMLRATSGMFYDFADAPTQIRNEISAKFESYSHGFIKGCIPDLEISGSYKYRLKKGNDLDSPDLLIRDGGALRVIIECKATRMSYAARYAESPLETDPRGYGEIAKGVFQIWRYASHARRGIVSEPNERGARIGIVLTLDNWLSMAGPLEADVLDTARKLAEEKDKDIIEHDRIGIIFCPMEDMEHLLRISTKETFFDTIEKSQTERYKGWKLWNIHQDIYGPGRAAGHHPFHGKLGDLLPWHAMLGKGGEDD